jgi:hypothetical protein
LALRSVAIDLHRAGPGSKLDIGRAILGQATMAAKKPPKGIVRVTAFDDA